MAVRTRRLGIGNSIAPGATQQLLVVPAGRTAIVRFWSVVNAHASNSATVHVQVRTPSAVARLTAQVLLAAGERLVATHDDLALNPGDALEVVSAAGSVTSALHTYAAGSLLLGSPE